MKILKSISVLLVVILLINIPFVCFASAQTLADKTEFELKLSSVDAADAPGNILVQVYCTTDPSKLITTFGSTLVVNTDYIDLVSKDGKVVTDNYKGDSEILGDNFALYASKIGAKKQVFGGMKGLSIGSYNPSTKNMYIFICGMTVSGIKLDGKTELAKYYLKSKSDKVPASAIRVMQSYETGKDCPSRAVYSAEISSTTEGGEVVKSLALDIESALIDDSVKDDTTKAAEKTTAESKTETQTSSQSTTSKISADGIKKMSEDEIEKTITKYIDDDKDLNISDKVKKSAEYKAYEKALNKAKSVLADDKATKQDKAKALEELVEAKEALEAAFPEVAPAETEPAKNNKTIIYIAIALGACALAAAAVIIVIKYKKKNSN